MDRGFCLAVLWEQDPNDFLGIVVHKAYVIRRWGTDKGLGQLAKDGPRPNTALDPEACDWINKTQVHRRIRCNDSAWDTLL
jgi:hypothetical protein